MKKRIVFLTLISMFSLSATGVTSVIAQPRIVGVSVGDWFRLGDITVSWNSTHPNATFPPPGWEMLEEMNESEWMLLSIVDVSGTNITAEMTSYFKNGTEATEGGYIDIDTGEGNVSYIAISANLNTNDSIYSSGPYSSMRINETITRTYPDGTRETNHLNITYGPYSWNISETEYYYYLTMNFYWDKATGVIVEDYFEEINRTGEYNTTWSALARITDSNVWVIPEFPTWTSTPLILIVLTVVIVIYKRRLLKTPIH